VIHAEITKIHDLETCSKYLRMLRQWLSGNMSLEEFDSQAQQLISVELHSNLIVQIMAAVESDDAQANERTTPSYDSVSTPIGHIPTPKAMQAIALLASWEEGLVGGVEEGIGEEIFEHVKMEMTSLLENTLKMSRSYLETDTGFAHSFGIQKLNQYSASQPSGVRCIIPAKEPITAEDLLDCLDLNAELIANKTLRKRLEVRLECADQEPLPDGGLEGV